MTFITASQGPLIPKWLELQYQGNIRKIRNTGSVEKNWPSAELSSKCRTTQKLLIMRDSCLETSLSLAMYKISDLLTL